MCEQVKLLKIKEEKFKIIDTKKGQARSNFVLTQKYDAFKIP